jgi:cytochrome c553
MFGGLMTMFATLTSAAPPTLSPLLGTWQADIDHSTFQGRAPYRSGTMTFSAVDGSKVRVVSDVMTASSVPFHFEYQGAEDDTVVPVSGNPYYDSASNAWTDERTLTRTERRAGKVTGTTSMQLAPDRKSFTAKGQRLTPDGVNYVTSIVWTRVAANDAPVPTKSAAASSSPAGDAARGKSRSGELYCDACHGVNGNSENAEWPSLAGQNATYITRQLQLLRSGTRSSSEMQPIAATLSDSDIVDLAAHYSAQALQAGTADTSESKAIESLYRDGDPTRAIAACSSCHGADGRGNAVTGDPALRAQQPVYSSRQLEAYAKRTRYTSEQKSGNLETMYTISEKLTAEEMRGLADYLHAMH